MADNKKPQYKGHQIVAAQGRAKKAVSKEEMQVNVQSRRRREDDQSAKKTKYLKGYKIVPWYNTNQKAIQHKIFLTNYERDSCPVCQKHLMDYVNIIQISEKEGIRVPGKYCSRCEMFWETRGTTLRNLIQRIPNSLDYEVNSEYLIPDYDQKMKLVKTIVSASMVVHIKLEGKDIHRMVVIVLSRSERNRDMEILHYTDLLARKLLFAIHQKSMQIQIDGNEYKILKYSYAEKQTNDISNYVNIDKIVIQPGGGLYQGYSQTRTELVDVLLYSPFTKCFEVSHASYDVKNRFYYMDAKVFRKFISEYGNPGIEVGVYESSIRDFSSMREESFLHAYGYSVAQSAGLSESSRQALLGEVMDLGLMTAHGILCLLEHNINMHPGDKYMHARSCWEADKEFIMKYKVNPNRFVVSTIGLCH